MMKTSIDFVQDIEKTINDLLTYSVGLELQVVDLKKIIKLLAHSFALNEEGEVIKSLTPEQAEYIKRICEKYHVFGYEGIQ